MRSCISLYDLFYKENEHHKITSLSGAPLAAYLRGVLYFSPTGIFFVGLNYLTKKMGREVNKDGRSKWCSGLSYSSDPCPRIIE